MLSEKRNKFRWSHRTQNNNWKFCMFIMQINYQTRKHFLWTEKKWKTKKGKHKPTVSLVPNKVVDPLHQWLGEEAWKISKKKNAVCFFFFRLGDFQNSYKWSFNFLLYYWKNRNVLGKIFIYLKILKFEPNKSFGYFLPRNSSFCSGVFGSRGIGAVTGATTMWSGAADSQSEGDLSLDLISTLQSQLLSLQNRVQVPLLIHTSYIIFPFQ